MGALAGGVVVKLPLPKLVLPFFVVGLAITFFFVELFGFSSDRGNEVWLGWLLLVTTPLLCAALGAFIAPKGEAQWYRLLWLAPAAGGINGSVAGLVGCGFERDMRAAAVPVVFFFGIVVGGVCSAAYLPGLAWVARTTRGIANQGRKGSILEQAALRVIWGSALSVVGSNALLAILVRATTFEPLVVTGATVLGAIGFAVLLALDLRDLRQVRAFAARPKRPSASSEPAAETIDYGTGGGVYEEIAAPGSAYREIERVVRTYLGDPAPTTEFLRRRMIANAGGVVALVVIAIFGMTRGAASSTSMSTPSVEPNVPDPLQTLYDAHVHGAMIGVDATGHRAYVANAEEKTVDTIDLARGEIVERHEFPLSLERWTQADRAPSTEPHASSFAWYAGMMRAIGPTYMRPIADSHGLVAAGDGARFVFRDLRTNDEAWHVIADPAPPRLVPNLSPDDVPLFAPDGQSIVWAGSGFPYCDIAPCKRYLYIAPIPKDGAIVTTKVDAISHAESPVWSADGKYIYVVDGATDDNKTACLWRVLAKSPYSAESVLCHEWNEFRFEQDETGAAGIVTGTRAEGPLKILDIDWIELPSGHIKRSQTTDSLSGVTLPNSAGLVLAMRWRDVVIYDLKTNCKKPIFQKEGLKWPVHARWIDDHRVVMQLEHSEPEVEIVSIDASRLTCFGSW